MTRDELEKATEQSTNSLHELYARACELHPFFQQGNLLQAAITPEEGYSEIAKLASSLFPTDSGALYLCEAENSIEKVACWPPSPARQESLKRDDCYALRRGDVHWVDADCQRSFCKHVPASSCSSYMCVPMVAHGKTLGVLQFKTGSGGQNQSLKRTRLPEAKRKLAEKLAIHIAPLIANLRLREQLTAQATRDPLTGLLNRRLLDETVGSEIRRAS